MKLPELKRHAKEYVELEADATVTSVRFDRRFHLFGREDVVLKVTTDDIEDPDWWVIGGGTPMNLYSRRKYPEVDEAYSLHTGLMLRMTARDFEESEEEPEDIGYDVFLSHASEDKDAFVRPLAEALRKLSFRVWYDEFELRVGDSLRESIDHGLSTSRYGIVVLSPSFFAKNWPQRELNGLTAMETDGRNAILPIWHGVTREDVLRYSPPLADKVALDSQKRSAKKMAAELAKVLSE